MAYVSGSYPLDQRKFVRNLATKSEVPTCQSWASEQEDGISQSARGDSREKGLTVMQKNMNIKPNKQERNLQPPYASQHRQKPISIGSVTTKSVPMTSLRLGFLLPPSHLFGEVKAEGRADMAE
jgi:hypothetical protein